MFFIWFIERIINRYYSETTLNKEVLDNPHKDIKHKVFGSDFAVQIYFKRLSNSEQSLFQSTKKEPISENHIQITEEI